MTSRQHKQNQRFIETITPDLYDFQDGVTGKLDSSGNPLPNASYGLTRGDTWVRLEGEREGAAVLNGVVNPYTPNIPVHTAKSRKYGRRVIVDLNRNEAFRLFPSEVVNRMAVPTPLVFDSNAVVMGKVEPDSERGGLWVFVREFVHDTATFASGERQHYDLAAEVAALSADAQVMVIVGVDTSSNALSVTVGDEKSPAYTYALADADDIIVPAGVIPLAALVLKDGQTLITDCFGVTPPRYFDQRQFLNLPGSSGGGGATSTGAYASLPAAGNDGNLYFANDVPYLLRDNGASWDAFWNNIPVTVPPSSGWSWDNQGGATIDSLQYLEFPAASGVSHRVRYRTAPSTPYVIDALLVPNVVGAVNVAFGVCFRQSSDGKLVSFFIQYDAGGVVSLCVQKFTTSTSFSGTYVAPSTTFPQRVWFRIADNGTNRICSIFDGYHAVQLHSVGRTDFLTADQVGFFANANNATYGGGVQLLSWKET